MMINKEHQELLRYLNKWLGIWNEKCLFYYFIPKGNELNYKQAKEINDLLGDLLTQEIPL